MSVKPASYDPTEAEVSWFISTYKTSWKSTSVDFKIITLPNTLRNKYLVYVGWNDEVKYAIFL